MVILYELNINSVFGHSGTIVAFTEKPSRIAKTRRCDYLQTRNPGVFDLQFETSYYSRACP